jgi:hypothetical protein
MGFSQPDAASNPLTSEEDRIHRQLLEAMRNEVASGRTFRQAAAVLAGVEESLRRLIMDDFLKITIAEEHFSKGRAVEQVADLLGLIPAELDAVRDVMLEEVGQELARQYREELARTSH